VSDPTRLGLIVKHADGTATRWTPEETNAENLLQDLQFSTAAPGGFRDLSCSLLRGLQPKADENLLDTVQVIGAGGRTYWEGRLHQFPRQSGTTNSVNPGAVGWSAHLEDNPTYTHIFVDRDPTAWQPSSLARRVALNGGGINLATISTDTGDGIQWNVPPGSLPPSTAELVYTAPPGSTVLTIAYKGHRAGTMTNAEPPVVWSANRQDLSDLVYPGDQFALTLDDNVHLASQGVGRYLMLRLFYGTTTTIAAGTAQVLSEIIVYGTQPSLTTPNDAFGYTARDAVFSVLKATAPLLNYTVGNGVAGSASEQAATIKLTDFPISQLAFKEPVTASDAIHSINAYENYDWFVWENRTFYYQPPGTGTEWTARSRDGAQLSLEGDNAQSIYNGVVVYYTDPYRGPSVAGPVGSKFDVESSALQDTNPDNPVNAHGIPRRWLIINLSFMADDAGAVQIGAIALAEANLASRSGSITLTGFVRDSHGRRVPVAAVRAGDTIRMLDLPNDANTAPRRIVETTYTHAQRSNQLTINSPSSGTSALLERFLVNRPPGT
jgi:hypothetical protein